MRFRAGLRNDVHALLEQPPERDVRGRLVVAAGDIRQYGVLKDILLAQWRVSRYGHVVFQAPIQHVPLFIARMVFDLVDADRCFRNGAGLFHLLDGEVADADASGPAGVEDRVEGANWFFHGHVNLAASVPATDPRSPSAETVDSHPPV